MLIPEQTVFNETLRNVNPFRKFSDIIQAFKCFYRHRICLKLSSDTLKFSMLSATDILGSTKDCLGAHIPKDNTDFVFVMCEVPLLPRNAQHRH